MLRSFHAVRAVFLLSVLWSSPAFFAGGGKPYNPEADAKAQIRQALDRAKQSNKHVLLQIGGNWCSWCLKLEKLYKKDEAVAKALSDNYELVYINHSKENKNEAVLAELGSPQRFGFPVLVVLDGKGNRLHTQDSVYLEEGDGHGPKKVLRFLEQWSPKALNPSSH